MGREKDAGKENEGNEAKITGENEEGKENKCGGEVESRT